MREREFAAAPPNPRMLQPARARSTLAIGQLAGERTLYLADSCACAFPWSPDRRCTRIHRMGRVARPGIDGTPTDSHTWLFP